MCREGEAGSDEEWCVVFSRASLGATGKLGDTSEARASSAAVALLTLRVYLKRRVCFSRDLSRSVALPFCRHCESVIDTADRESVSTAHLASSDCRG